MAPMMSRQVTPHEQWTWMDQYHWKHWHGMWVRWRPFESPEFNKSYRSVRSFQAENEERTVVRHKNQWYDPSGPNEEPKKWMFGPWRMTEEENSFENGIMHPGNPNARLLILPNGDLGWMPLEFNPLASKSNPDASRYILYGEIHFLLPSRDGRMAVILGHSADGSIGASLVAEETMDTDNRPDSTWQGNVWKHELVRRALAQSREEPAGDFIGTEMTLTTSLQLTTTQGARWTGFKGGLQEQESEEDYVLIHLPYNITACVRKQIVEGRPICYAVHWLVNEDQVRSIVWRYSDEGKLLYIKTSTYNCQPTETV